MTDLESPKKNNDCYFYYYSTCAKGDNCTFRHEPSALGCETMCSFWKEGKCLNVHCNFRHMELRKNRKVIPCYWESQPVGCLKAHCPFLHQNPRPSDEVSSEKSNISTESTDGMLKEQLNQPSERKVSTVDSLVVNFEEESDNESSPTFSPIKTGNRIVKVKTLEEIKLEKIQAESAAYYSYYGEEPRIQISSDNGDDIRQRIVRRIVSKNLLPQERTVTVKTKQNDRIIRQKRLSNDDLASILGDESLRKRQKIVHQTEDGNFQIVINKRLNKSQVSPMDYREFPVRNRHPLVRSINNPEVSIQNIRIKTLAEIRAEKLKSFADRDESEVSSTSADETMVDINVRKDTDVIKDVNPRRKIKLRRKFPPQENIVSSNDQGENTITSNASNIFSKVEDRDGVSLEEVNKFLKEKRADARLHSEEFITQPFSQHSGSNSDKTDEEVLLLEADDDEYDNVPLKGEDELLNEIDSLFSD